MLKQIFSKDVIIKLLFFWLIVVLFQIFSSEINSFMYGSNALILFVVLLFVIVFASFTVVKQADVIAHKLGEPYGTLILTLSIVVIEVVLILAMLFGEEPNPTIAKDSVFSVLMIIINLVVGACLLIGGIKYQHQSYNAPGIMSYLSMIIILGGIGIILPSFVNGKGNGELTEVQAISIAIATLVLYFYFLYNQIGKYSFMYKQPQNNEFEYTETYSISQDSVSKIKIGRSELVWRIIVLIIFILPIVLLSHNLGAVVDYEIKELNLPNSLGGIIIAIIVFTPESITALKAVFQNELQRTINLCHGACVSTVGLTIPSVLIIGLLMDKQILLGLTNTEIVLFIVTFLLSLLAFNGRKTYPLLGALHLVLFVIYIVLIFNS